MRESVFDKIFGIKRYENEALSYHAKFPQGKIETKITKSLKARAFFGLAYTPGVAEPCKKIATDPETVFDFTNKSNTVAVVSNGTAVLGLGNIGPAAGKPVMEGKSLLFKFLAGIDAFDLNIDIDKPELIADFVKAVAPTFGGINLEDVAAPGCFVVDEIVRSSVDIPFFHDDQSGTAVVVAAALKNAAHLVNKEFETLKIVVSGAGAAAMAVVGFLNHLGIPRKNFLIFDREGLLTLKRDLNSYKMKFAQERDLTIREALIGADVFIGLSSAGLISQDDIKGMAEDPIVFAMANPIPEIMPNLVKEARSDAIIGSGRPDFPNQVNNVLCFPFLFRGALDVRASSISIGMQVACCRALAKVARELPDFGREKILPDPFDPTLIYNLPRAVAEVAIEEGLARHDIPDNYNTMLDIRVYGDYIEDALIPDVANEAAVDVVRILREHKINKSSGKNLYSLNLQEILEKISTLKNGTLVFNEMEVVFGKDGLLKCDNPIELIHSLEESDLDFIGVVTSDEIFFNNSNRPWYATKLCSERIK